MSGVDTRTVARNSLFLLANLRIEQGSEVHRVRVRNLSDGGMMAEGDVFVQRGHRLEVELRNIGKIGGSVAWVQDKRFGIAFDREVDSQRARQPIEAVKEASDPASVTSWAHRAPPMPAPGTLRKV